MNQQQEKYVEKKVFPTILNFFLEVLKQCTIAKEKSNFSIPLDKRKFDRNRKKLNLDSLDVLLFSN